MIRWTTLLAELAVAAGIFSLCGKFLWRKLGNAAHVIVMLLGVCAVFVSFSGASVLFEAPKRTVTITALNQKNSAALENTIYLTDFRLDGSSYGVPDPLEGQWAWKDNWYCWFDEEDERHQDGMTRSVTFELPTAWETEASFWGNKWKGKTEIQLEGKTVPVDTCLDQDGSETIRVELPHPSVALMVETVLASLLGFTVTLLVLCAVLTLLVSVGQRIAGRLGRAERQPALIKKLLRYQFLFEELVKRDFKKKYKRTVLGMAWSVLSPLLTLLVMRLVFTQFFGRNTPHYTTYLFCGNLIFSYFNESTSQGMTSLVGNAGIFTKVNVPKYLFLFSKNVQTLINFGLTLCVFFVFCMLDNITFTWKFVCLLYPIFCLVLFNIGVGLVLSALFVFFRDIQYLWSVFTQLLMYMSAIFYIIDNYSPTIRNLFLLNPVYLFIRYFRKIVIEATIPTVWFHLLMLADVVIVLGIGCWMYKKYNHKFLYYV